MPTGPVTKSKAWIEMVHRYLATGVGVLILTLAAMTWWLRRQSREVSPWLPTLTLVWVCMQGAFGALTVTMKLFPAIVTLHLMGGIGLLVLLMAQAVRYDGAGTRPLPSPLRAGLWAGFVLLCLQIALGGWVSTNYAVLACTEFPMCQGSWWPHMDLRQGFEIWRQLGVDSNGNAIAFAALTGIHYVHRISAYVVILAVWWFSWSAWRQGHNRLALSLLVLTLWQFISGLTIVVLDLSLVASVAHTAGAAGFVIVLAGAWAEQGLHEGRASLFGR
jgi:cytochrome c oxidase assembly protein subunit 15